MEIEKIKSILFFISLLVIFCFYWSALATIPASTSALAGAKEVIHFIDFFVCCLSNHKSNTSRPPRKLKFSMQSYFNPTKRNMKKKLAGPENGTNTIEGQGGAGFPARRFITRTAVSAAVDRKKRKKQRQSA